MLSNEAWNKSNSWQLAFANRANSALSLFGDDLLDHIIKPTILEKRPSSIMHYRVN